MEVLIINITFVAKQNFMPLIEENAFPSIHDRRYMHNGHLCSIFEIGSSLPARNMKLIINQLKAQGIPVRRLEFYEYGPSDVMRHLFVWMEGETTSIPYFQLNSDYWKAIVELIVS